MKTKFLAILTAFVGSNAFADSDVEARKEMAKLLIERLSKAGLATKPAPSKYRLTADGLKVLSDSVVQIEAERLVPGNGRTLSEAGLLKALVEKIDPIRLEVALKKVSAHESMSFKN